MNAATDGRRRVVLVRHGHSEWNLSNRFTGWADIALTNVGLTEAARCGEVLAAHGFQFDEVHVSALRRSHQTADRLLRAAGQNSTPYFASWRLNERHYGQLQGMVKEEIFASWGDEQVRRWWRGYQESPPALEQDDPRHPRFDKLYRDIDPRLLPASESLEQCLLRAGPYWREVILRRVALNRQLLIVSHGNTMRSLRMLMEHIAPQDIEHVEIPSAVPLVYHFDSNMELQELEWLPVDQSDVA